MDKGKWSRSGVSVGDRISAQVDSINDTAKMVRISVSLYLAVALYLFLSLVSSTDEALLRNNFLKLPQFQTFVTLKLSYTVAPLIFILLHIQTLFYLIVISKKIYKFEIYLSRIFRNDKAAVEECRDRLSATSFVQRNSDTGSIRILAKALTWLVIGIIPFLLFLLIDTSFLRYQSTSITATHHCYISIHLISLYAFSRIISNQTIIPKFLYVCFLIRPPALRDIVSQSRRKNFFHAAISIFISLLVVALWAFAWPKDYEQGEYNYSLNGPRKLQWDERSHRKKIGNFNLFDDVLCGEHTRFLCRVLDLSNLTLTQQGRQISALDVGKVNPEIVRQIRRIYGLNLVNRKLRFAKFNGTFMPGAQLAGAHLEGAEFNDADLQGADFSNAKMQDTDWKEARMSGATLKQGSLHGAILEGATMDEVILKGAELPGAILNRVRLEKAILEDTNMPGAHLEWIQAAGARFAESDLYGVSLRWADLREVNLVGVDLAGASLEHADVRGANLENTNLFGARLPYAKMDGATLKGLIIVGIQGNNIRGRPYSGEVVGSVRQWAKVETCVETNVECFVRGRPARADTRLAWEPSKRLAEYLTVVMNEYQGFPLWALQESP